MKNDRIQVLRAETEWVACVKPVGLDSEKAVPDVLKEQLGGEIFPVHRLDQNVGGVMICARTQRAAGVFSRMIREGAFRKEYLAMVHGQLPPEGRMEDLLWKDARQNKVFVVQRERKNVRKAALRYCVLGSAGEDRTLAAVFLETGRSHQIRVQFAARKCPLWGDHKYGARDKEKAPLLFSRRIIFPWQGEEVVCEAVPAWGNACV